MLYNFGSKMGHLNGPRFSLLGWGMVGLPNQPIIGSFPKSGKIPRVDPTHQTFIPLTKG